MPYLVESTIAACKNALHAAVLLLKSICSRSMPSAAALEDSGAAQVIKDHLLANVEEFRRLEALREKVSLANILYSVSAANGLFVSQGWQNPAGDTYFTRQRRLADDTAGGNNSKTSTFFYQMMQRNGKDLHDHSGAFTVVTPHLVSSKILDM